MDYEADDQESDENEREDTESGENEGESEQPKEKDPNSKRSSLAFWQRWIKGARKSANETWKDADQAWREYDDGKRNSEETQRDQYDDYQRPYPLYWSIAETVKPAFYARQPKLIARREFDIEDPDALTACLIAERLSAYNIKACAFDSTIQSAVSDLIHASKTCTQLVYSEQMVERPAQIPVVPDPMQPGVFYTPDKQPVTDQIQQGPQGYFINVMQQVPFRKVGIKPVIYDEVIHDPEARSDEDITAIGLHFCMDYDEAKERFCKNEDGSYKEMNLPFKSKSDYYEDDREKERDDIPGKYLEGWEIWDIKTGMVRWVNCDYTEGFLDEKKDPYGLARFFPVTRFLITNKPAKSLYARPNYTRLRPTINKLHDLYSRKFLLIDGIRRRCLVDGSEPDLVDALNSLETGQFIAVSNLQNMLDKGGLQNLILFIPVQELVQAIAEINNLEEEFKNLCYELWGVPDILRGVSDPQEALGTQQIKSTAAHDRFKVTKMAVQEMVRESIEMMLDLSVRVMDPMQIKEICGVQFWNQDQQARFDRALAILQNDQTRLIRIDIETDSTSFIDQQAEIAKRKMIGDAVISGLAMLGKMENQEFAPVVLQVLLYQLSALGGSKEFEDGVKRSVMALFEKKNQPAPAAPPPPDYERMKIEVAAMKAQSDAVIENRKLDQKQMELSLEERDREFTRELEAIRAEMDRQMNQFVQAAESQRLQNERYEVIMSQREKMIEEQRLALDAAIAMQQQPRLPETPQPPQIIQVSPPELPPITINVKSEPKKRRAKIIRDEFGGAMLEIDDAAPDLVPIG